MDPSNARNARKPVEFTPPGIKLLTLLRKGRLLSEIIMDLINGFNSPASNLKKQERIGYLLLFLEIKSPQVSCPF